MDTGMLESKWCGLSVLAKVKFLKCFSLYHLIYYMGYFTSQCCSIDNFLKQCYRIAYIVGTS